MPQTEPDAASKKALAPTVSQRVIIVLIAKFAPSNKCVDRYFVNNCSVTYKEQTGECLSTTPYMTRLLFTGTFSHYCRLLL